MGQFEYGFVHRDFIDPLPKWRDLRHPRPALFLDRDGVINEEVDYLSDVNDLHLIEGVAEAIAKINAREIPVVVVTNQAGIARGFFDADILHKIHHEMIRLLAKGNATLQGIFYSPFHPEMSGPFGKHSPCRKPGAGMLRAAAEEFSLDLENSVLVGDRKTDMMAAHEVGAKAILVKTGYGAGGVRDPETVLSADFIVDNLPDAVRLIDEKSWF